MQNTVRPPLAESSIVIGLNKLSNLRAIVQIHFSYYIGVQRLVNDTNSTGSILASANIFVQTSLPPVNCSFRAYTRACLYWDTTDEDWSDRGCQVGFYPDSYRRACIFIE